MAEDLTGLRAKLDGIAEELAVHVELRLRAAVDAGSTEAPIDERLLVRARRSVEKASHILAEVDELGA